MEFDGVMLMFRLWLKKVECAFPYALEGNRDLVGEAKAYSGQEPNSQDSTGTPGYCTWYDQGKGGSSECPLILFYEEKRHNE